MLREVYSLRPGFFRKPFPVWQDKRMRQVIHGIMCAWLALEKSRFSRTIFGRVPNGFPESRWGFDIGEFGVPEIY